jgi:hypothetical protein
MTTTIAEDENRDLYLGADGNIAFLTAAPCVAQLTKSRVESQRGEMMYAADQGMPTRATAWDTFNPKQFEAAARSIITATPDVTGIESFTMQKQDNDLSYQATINTIYGTVNT